MKQETLLNYTLKPSLLKTTGWFLTICFIGMTFIPRSFDDTLFVDGLTYAAISRNMAAGKGTFWQPYFADSFWMSYNDRCAFFCEHPPLMLGMESLLFRVLGDTTAVENIYNTIVLAVIILLIVLVWKKLFKKNKRIKTLAWLPVLYWYALRVVWWSVPNNLLDTTMAIFCLLACYFQLHAFSSPKFRNWYWILSGIMVFLACLVKGPVGLYPLALPVIYVIVFGKNHLRIAVPGLSITITAFFVLTGLILLYPPANYFLTNYFQGQVVLALLQKREKVRNDWTAHIYLLKVLITNIIPHLIITGSLYIISIYSKLETRISTASKKVFLLTLFIAISGIFPMLISVKQGDYYLMPALPFVGLFFAALTVEILMSIISRFNSIPQILFPALTMVFCIAAGYKLVHPEKDYMFETSRKIAEYVPDNSTIYLPKEIFILSEIHAPFQRYNRLSMTSDLHQTKYLFFDNPDNEVLDSIKKTSAYQIISIDDHTTLAILK